MELQQGNSGCKLFLLSKDGRSFVRKFSAHSTYGARLITQAAKQQAYSEISNLPFYVPAVYMINQKYFDMEHFVSRSAMAYLLEDGKNAADKIFECIAKFISHSIAKSNYEVLDLERIAIKIESVYKGLAYAGITAPFSQEELIRYVNDHKQIMIPAGNCHGDLTLSNILIGEKNKIAFIDFLDTFYETPLQDMVKIRQDTQYAWWSILPNSFTVSEKTKNAILMQHLDKRFDVEFMRYSFYKNTYTLFQTISILRILPYVTDHLQRKILVYNALRDLRAKWT